MAGIDQAAALDARYWASRYTFWQFSVVNRSGRRKQCTSSLRQTRREREAPLDSVVAVSWVTLKKAVSANRPDMSLVSKD